MSKRSCCETIQASIWIRNYSLERDATQRYLLFYFSAHSLGSQLASLYSPGQERVSVQMLMFQEKRWLFRT